MSDDATKDMVETVDVSPRDPDVPQATGGDVFRQLLHQAVRVADMANSQAMRMALDFAKVYEREQGVRKDFESQLKQMTLMEKQATRYAEDLAAMLRSERERRQELERALEQERIASEELRRTGLQGISHLVLAATIKDRSTGPGRRRRGGRRWRRGRGSPASPRSSPDRWPAQKRACSSGSARRSRPQLTTTSAEAQPSKARSRGDADDHRKSDEDSERHHQQISEPITCQGPIDIVPHQIGAYRAAEESRSGADGHS